MVYCNVKHFQSARFIKSAPTLKDLPGDFGAEIAFIGRSNAGKSSAINAITGISLLARASKTPGRTQLMNCFSLVGTNRLIDLPGFGYAKVSATERARFARMISTYLENRASLCALVLVMDSRHPLQPMDQEMLDWCFQAKVYVHILLTKADKLTASACRKLSKDMESALAEQVTQGWVTMQLFSATKKIGLDEARSKLAHYFNLCDV